MQKASITLRKFLHKYTAISYEFIDEYIDFYDLCVEDKYGIYLIDVMDYLEITNKKKFMERFRENYVNKVDYIIERKENIQDPQQGITKYYFVTFETFQKICMKSKSEKANNVRDYFITLHKFIDNYKKEIDEKLEHDFYETMYGVIYILLVNKERSIRKIGIVKEGNVVKNRLKNYMTGKDKHPDIELLVKIKDPKEVENCVEKLLKSNKLKGKEDQEIYKVDFKTAYGAIVSCSCISIGSETIEKLKNNTDCYVIFSNSD